MVGADDPTLGSQSEELGLPTTQRSVGTMYNLESMICPWVGCGGTIVGKAASGPEGTSGWSCDTCGEFFTSPEDYQSKLRTENEWAQTWLKWGKENQSANMEIESGLDAVGLEADQVPAEPTE
jgi:hypothetical protein